jgi:putative spermidine/putrescine transport system substrate-binding protein
MKNLGYLIGLSVACLAATGFSASAQTVTFVSYGGVYQEGQVKAMMLPATESLRYRLRQETHGGLQELRAQVKSGAVTWDIVNLSSGECALGAKEGLFEKLDYSVINADGIPEAARQPYWIGEMLYASVIAYNTKKYGANPPKTWADFWNVQKFPGTRSLYGIPRQTFEAALLADGVPLDKVYPIDIERAARSLEKIKPHITVWWKSGGQSAQLLKDGAVDMIGIWASRAAAVKAAGGDVDYTVNEAVVDLSCFVIPKGAPSKDAAMKVLAKAVSPELQANIPLHLDYGPVNEKAYATGKITPERLKQLVTAPENVSKQVMMQPSWWGDNLAKAQETFDNLLAK